MNLDLNSISDAFSELSLGDLLKVQAQIDQKVKIARLGNRKKVRDQIILLAHENGYKMHDLFPELQPFAQAKPTKEKKTIAPRYRNPTNAQETWSGRGRKPVWVVEWLNTHGDLQSVQIDDSKAA